MALEIYNGVQLCDEGLLCILPEYGLIIIIETGFIPMEI